MQVLHFSFLSQLMKVSLDLSEYATEPQLRHATPITDKSDEFEMIADHLKVSQIVMVVNKTFIERLKLSAADHFDIDYRQLPKKFL